jgi:hypothetical protein
LYLRLELFYDIEQILIRRGAGLGESNVKKHKARDYHGTDFSGHMLIITTSQNSVALGGVIAHLRLKFEKLCFTEHTIILNQFLGERNRPKTPVAGSNLTNRLF